MEQRDLKAQLEASPGRRITEEAITKRIAFENYFTIPNTTVTICHIMLDNGYSVRGESACVDHANFNQQIGEHYAREDAFKKLWPLFGFLLAEDIHRGEPKVQPVEIARVAHEVNRAYCASLGDNSQPAWEDAPAWQKGSAVTGVNAHLETPLSPEESHALWMAHKQAEGWTYGPEKDPSLKLHPCMVPYDQLPAEQRTKDFLFKAVVEALS